MIGVICRPEQRPVVEEFFELFKTPWQFYRPGDHQDVIITTADVPEDVTTRLLLVYRPDPGAGHASAPRRVGCVTIERGAARVPLYGAVSVFDDSRGATCVGSSLGRIGIRVSSNGTTVYRLGYDLFEEVRVLLTEGQPVEYAGIPTLDEHIAMLRDWIVPHAGPLVEVRPVPAGRTFVVCLTHDIDFVGIRRHLFDRAMWGFLYRSTVGAVRDLLTRRISLGRAVRMWGAALSLPLVYLGWKSDFWEPFGWYLQAEKDLPATYFLIPFKGVAGAQVPGSHPDRRAVAYDVTELGSRIRTLQRHGCEIGVHAIDAWASEASGRDELERVTAMTGTSSPGVRVHWLLARPDSARLLERAGYSYDSTVGYNETIGYRAGTSQVFRPLGAESLLELPLHVQDGALFYPSRLHLREREAWHRCLDLIQNSRNAGGVLTLLWHDRSHGPERFWGDFYLRLLRMLRSIGPWFATASRAVDWFRQRREVKFEPVSSPAGSVLRLHYPGGHVLPPFSVRFHRPDFTFTDVAWDGGQPLVLELPAGPVSAGYHHAAEAEPV